jgi:hypothetical protein
VITNEACNVGRFVSNKEKVFVGRSRQELKQGIDGGVDLVLRPSQKNHWAVKTGGPVVILRGVHEDFLSCTCAAWSEDHTTLVNLNEAAFPDTIIEILCDPRGEGIGWLKTKRARRTRRRDVRR